MVMSARLGQRLVALMIVANALLGALMVLAPGAARAGFSWLIFGDPQRIDGFMPEARGYITLLHGVLGAVMIGWSVALLGLWRRRQSLVARHAWPLVAASLGSWWTIDTLFSAAQGAWPNVLLNLAFGLPLALGLALTRSDQATDA